MSAPKIFIDGEAGTTGLQIRARLDARDDIEVVSIASDKRKNQDERRRLLNDADLVILCLPDDTAREAVSLVENSKTCILDASSAHRVDPDWVYGFPELCAGQADAIRGARLVSNPGCYPTGAVALIRPLVDAGLLATDYPICINAVSGYTGGGKKLIEQFESNGPDRIADTLRLYALELAHKHPPEMRLHGRLSHTPLFTPAYAAFAQGMLVQVPLPLWSFPKVVTGRQLHEALADRYQGQRFVRVMPFDNRPGVLGPEALNGTNLLELFVFDNPKDEAALLVARLDNLGKGASGAAVQNMDLMLGLAGDRSYVLAEAAE